MKLKIKTLAFLAALSTSYAYAQIGPGGGGSGGGGNNSVSNTGSGIPSFATYLGFSSGGLLTGVSSANPLPVSATFSGTIGTVNQGTGAAAAAAWPFYLVQGGSVLSAANPIFVNIENAITGTVTANAGTNLNTSALALENGGNLASLVSQIGAVSGSPAANTVMARLAQINTTLGSPLQAGGSVSISGNLPAFAATPSFNLSQIGSNALAAGTNWGTAPSNSSVVLNANVNCLAGCPSSGGSSQVDEAAFTQGTTSFTAIGGIYTTSVTNLTSGQAGVVRLTPDRNLFANINDWAGTALGAPSQYGTSPGAVYVPGVNAYVTNLPPVTGTVTANLGTLNGAALASNQPTNSGQGSTLSGQTGTLAQGAVTTTAPVYANNTANPLSLTPAGALRADIPAVESTAGSASTSVFNIQGNPGGTPIPVTGTLGATFDGFVVNATTYLNATTGNQYVAIPGSGNQVFISNPSAYQVNVLLGNGTVAATTTNSTPIEAGGCQIFNTNGSATQVAAISAGTSQIIIQSGTGTPLACAGSSTGSGGGTVAQGAGSSFSAPWYFALSQGGIANSATNPIFTQLTAGTAAIGSASLTQGGSALSTTNGLYTNLLQGNAALSATNGVYVAPTTSSVFSTSAAANAYADGAITTLGLENNSACASTTGSCTLIAIEKLIANSVSGSIPAGTNTIGAVTQASGPWTQNITQWNSVALGNPSTYGTAPGAVNVPGVNAYITNTPSVSISSPLGPAQTPTAAVAVTPIPGTYSITTTAQAVPGGSYLLSAYTAGSWTGASVTVTSAYSSGQTQTISQSGGSAGPFTSNTASYCVQIGQGATVAYSGTTPTGTFTVTLAGSPGCVGSGGGSSSTVAQGTAAALSGAWPLEITDGTHGPVAVKAASTPPAYTDPALVTASLPVAISAITDGPGTTGSTAYTFSTPTGLGANASRKGCTIQNPPGNTLNLAIYWGTGTPSSSNYSYVLPPGQTFQCNGNGIVIQTAIQVAPMTASAVTYLASSY